MNEEQLKEFVEYLGSTATELAQEADRWEKNGCEKQKDIALGKMMTVTNIRIKLNKILKGE